MRTSMAVALVVGPVGSAAATYFWDGDGRYGVTGGAVLVLATLVWGYGLVGLVEQVRDRMPRFAAVALPLVLLGMLGGIAFGYQGFYEGVFGMSGEQSLAALAEHPAASQLVLWLPGPMMPLCVLTLAIGLGRGRLIPGWLAVLLGAGAVLFPVSRIPRIDLVAYAADGLLVLGFAALAWHVGTAKRRSGQP